MDRIKHKRMGEGTIISRDKDLLTVRFDKTGKEIKLSIPGSFDVDNGLFELEGDLKAEIEAAVKEKKTKDEEAAKARAAAGALKDEKAATTVRTTGSKHKTKKTPATITHKHAIEADFETYLIKSGYKIESDAGNPSTVSSYINGVKSVLTEEGLTWNSLVSKIPTIVVKYDIGGPKEDFGKKQKSTVISSLKRFEDFVKINHITP